MKDAIDVTFGGKDYRIRPTFGAIVQIEEKLGRSLLAIVGDVRDPKDIRMKDVAIILHEGLIAAGATITLAEVGDEIVSRGFSDFIHLALQFVGNAIMPGPEKTLAGESKSG